MSDKQRAIVMCVGASAHRAKDIELVASETGMSKQTIIGCLNGLRKDNLATYSEGKISLTVKGVEMLNIQPAPKAVDVAKPRGRTADPTSKRAIAEGLLAANSTLRRKEKVALLMEHCKMSDVTANTYIYNYTKKLKAQAEASAS